MIYPMQVMEQLKQRLEEELKLTDALMQQLPSGDLRVDRCNGHDYYLQRTREDGRYQYHYLGAEELKTVSALADKSFFRSYRKILIQNYKAVVRFLQSYSEAPQFAALGKLSSRKGEVLARSFLPKDENQRLWMLEPYERSTYREELLTVETKQGFRVRTKSECMIADSLGVNHIANRYECKLVLKNRIVYPDFTILHPDTNEVYYWEHFGMMDNQDYLEQSMLKLIAYADSGIFPEDRLIITMETRSNPLSSRIVQETIERHFLRL